MIYIDASAYIAILIPYDSNKKAALKIAEKVYSQEKDTMTSYAILGEVLTVGSQRYNRKVAVDFVSSILDSKMTIVMENNELLSHGIEIFARIQNKNVSWVDCYSFAIIKHYNIENVFSFDRDFEKYSGAQIIA